MVFKGLILVSFYFERVWYTLKDWFYVIFTLGGCGGVKRTDLDYWLSGCTKSKTIELQICVCVCMCLCVYRLSYRQEFLAELASGKLSELNWVASSSLSVLASFSFVYSTAYHVVDASELI